VSAQHSYYTNERYLLTVTSVSYVEGGLNNWHNLSVRLNFIKY